jgi:hypothetical protein
MVSKLTRTLPKVATARLRAAANKVESGAEGIKRAGFQLNSRFETNVARSSSGRKVDGFENRALVKAVRSDFKTIRKSLQAGDASGIASAIDISSRLKLTGTITATTTEAALRQLGVLFNVKDALTGNLWKVFHDTRRAGMNMAMGFAQDPDPSIQR